MSACQAFHMVVSQAAPLTLVVALCFQEVEEYMALDLSKRKDNLFWQLGCYECASVPGLFQPCFKDLAVA